MHKLAEELLSLFELEDILEMNDLEEVEVLSILISSGLIGQPEHIIEQFEEEDDEDS